MADTSLPQVRSWPWRHGYQGHFKKPGGAWQFVRGDDGKAVIFPSSEAAKDAATALVFRFMCPEIVADRPDEDSAKGESPCASLAVPAFLDTTSRKAERDERLAVERRTLFPGRGRGAVDVQVKRKRALAR